MSYEDTVAIDDPWRDIIERRGMSANLSQLVGACTWLPFYRTHPGVVVAAGVMLLADSHYVALREVVDVEE